LNSDDRRLVPDPHNHGADAGKPSGRGSAIFRVGRHHHRGPFCEGRGLTVRDQPCFRRCLWKCMPRCASAARPCWGALALPSAPALAFVFVLIKDKTVHCPARAATPSAAGHPASQLAPAAARGRAEQPRHAGHESRYPNAAPSRALLPHRAASGPPAPRPDPVDPKG
jgi:hypothetical protein